MLVLVGTIGTIIGIVGVLLADKSDARDLSTVILLVSCIILLIGGIITP